MSVNIKEQLDKAWEAHVNDEPTIAFERLHNAVSQLADNFEQQQQANRKVANDLSCLQNGITPD